MSKRPALVGAEKRPTTHVPTLLPCSDEHPLPLRAESKREASGPRRPGVCGQPAETLAAPVETLESVVDEAAAADPT